MGSGSYWPDARSIVTLDDFTTTRGDYDHLQVYKNNIFLHNLDNQTTEDEWTGLSAGTSYTISTRTVDLYGNVNQTWINRTVSTEGEGGSAPVAAFSGTPTSGNAPLTVIFTDSSSNAPTSWLWDFGDLDSTNATQENPVHGYAAAGTYTVKLTATNAYGNDDETKTDYITVNPAVIPPLAMFIKDRSIVLFAGTVHFTDTSLNEPTSWNWSFGDGTYSDDQNASHQYLKRGRWTVVFTATNSAGYTTNSTVIPVLGG